LYNRDKNLPKKYDFLSGYEKFIDKIPSNIDLVITFDASTKDRFAIDDINRPIISIDHHMNHQEFGDINIVDTNSVSTTLIVYKLLLDLNIKISKNIAQALYTGLVEDSGFFRYDRVDSNVFIVASNLINAGVDAHYVAQMLTQREGVGKVRLSSYAVTNMELFCDAKVAVAVVTKDMINRYGSDDTTDIANRLRNLATVDIGIVIKEELYGSIRVSLRSKTVDVSLIAGKFGGGGHIRASGFTVTNISIDELKSKLIGEIYV